MLNRHNVFHVSSQGYSLIRGKKWNTSRALRRFLTDVLMAPIVKTGPAAYWLLFQELANHEGFSEAQLNALETFAARIAEEQQGYLDKVRADANLPGQLLLETVKLMNTENHDESVYNTYRVMVNPETASLKELQTLVKAVVVLSDFLHQVVGRGLNEIVLRDFPMYEYRGLPCSIAPDEELWCISGADKLDNSGGILEWCYGEGDAKEVLQKMSQYPDRFSDLKAQSWLETNAPVAA